MHPILTVIIFMKKQHIVRLSISMNGDIFERLCLQVEKQRKETGANTSKADVINSALHFYLAE